MIILLFFFNKIATTSLRFQFSCYFRTSLVKADCCSKIETAATTEYNFKALSCEAAHLSPQFPCLSIENFFLLTYWLNK